MRRIDSRSLVLLFAAAATCIAPAVSAQPSQSSVLSAPLASQRAVVEQRIGVTDVTITYHRPLVGGRTVWGGIVPYGDVWRAGANQNTVIQFSDPVTIEGKALPRGSYGLHMIPNKDAWTIIFSNNSTSWGSFTYDKKEDALRVDVKPVASDPHEALTYEFDNLKSDSVNAVLKWEKLAVPIKIQVDVQQVALASLRNQLRNEAGFTWLGWNDAATYCLENKINYDEALKWVDTSIQNEQRFENLATKAGLLKAVGKTADASAAMEKALAMGTAPQVHAYARTLLLTDHNVDEAVRIFTMNAKKHPDVWIVHAGLARGFSAQGKYAEAAREMRLALPGAPENQRTSVEGFIKRLDAGQDINK